MTNPALGVYDAVSGNGATDPFTLTAVNNVYVASNAETVLGGTLQVFLDMQDQEGAWQTIVTLPAQTATGKQSSVVVPASVNPNLTTVARLRWTCTGGDVIFAGIVIGL